MDRRAPGGRYSMAREIRQERRTGERSRASRPPTTDDDKYTPLRFARYPRRSNKTDSPPAVDVIERPWLPTTQRRRACTKELDRAETSRRAHPVADRSRQSAETPSQRVCALVKADVHLARFALVLAEAELPGAGTPTGSASAEIVHRAAAIVAFTLDVGARFPRIKCRAIRHWGKQRRNSP